MFRPPWAKRNNPHFTSFHSDTCSPLCDTPDMRCSDNLHAYTHTGEAQIFKKITAYFNFSPRNEG